MESCEGASAAFDRDYAGLSAEAAVREEAPELLGLPADELTYARGGAVPGASSVRYNVWMAGTLVGVLAVVDRPGASGVEYYTACGQDRLPGIGR